jgi:hypothetical protein
MSNALPRDVHRQAPAVRSHGMTWILLNTDRNPPSPTRHPHTRQKLPHPFARAAPPASRNMLPPRWKVHVSSRNMRRDARIVLSPGWNVRKDGRNPRPATRNVRRDARLPVSPAWNGRRDGPISTSSSRNVRPPARPPQVAAVPFWRNKPGNNRLKQGEGQKAAQTPVPCPVRQSLPCSAKTAAILSLFLSDGFAQLHQPRFEIGNLLFDFRFVGAILGCRQALLGVCQQSVRFASAEYWIS